MLRIIKMISLLLVSIIIVSGQTEKFTIGLYAGNSGDWETTSINPEYYAKMKELGANLLIIQPQAVTKGRYEEDGIEIISDTPLDLGNYIKYYSGGYYTRWKAKEGLENDRLRTGLKLDTNVGEKEGDYWVTKNINTKGVLMFGPNYRQDKEYRIKTLDSLIQLKYKLELRYKLEEMEAPPIIPATVFTVNAEYIFKKGTKTTIPLAQTEVTTEEADGEFKTVTLEYNYQELINDYGEEAQKLIEYGTNNFDDSDTLQGLNIVIDYKGQTKLYIDYIDVYDVNIGYLIKNDASIINTNIQDYIERMQNKLPNTFRYWYSLDEPQTIDNYYPYTFVNNILKEELQSKPIITCLYPGWNGKNNGDRTIPKFVNDVNPDQFLYYYYPMWESEWASVDDINGSVEKLEDTRELLQDAYESYPNFWYTIQAHGFLKNNAWDKRVPHPNEINVQVMLALAHGAKGIFYYNLFSYSNNNETHDGLLDFNYNPTTRYTKIKDEITPRLKGELGDKLLKLNYTGEYLQKKNLIGGITNHDNSGFIDIVDTNNLNYQNYHVGLFENPNDTDDKCFMVVNLLCDTIDYRIATFTLLTPNYPNIIIRNIGGSYQKTFAGDAIVTFNDTIPPGEGYLYQVAPAIRYGGEIKTNETISTTNDTLGGRLAIIGGRELTINKPYVIKEDIHIESEGKIKVGIGGAIIKEGGEVTSQRWEDLFYINQNQTHPKLVWSINREYSNPIRYNIWRKKNTQSYEKIAVINDKNITEYTDTDTEIILGEEQANQTIASYYIQIEEITGRSWTPRKQSITATVSKVEGIPLEKQAEQINLEEIEFNISQNYPNPFNPTTSIKYTVPSNEYVTLKVYDILGNEVATLVNEQKESGNYTVNFDGDKLSSGLYIYKLQAGKFSQVRKMMLLK